MDNHHTSLNDLPRNPRKAGLDTYQLGIDPYVKGLVDFLKGTVTPMTIALQGEWGSGKTSLMYKLQNELCDTINAPYESVWINTWEYSLMSNSSEALLKIVAKMASATEYNHSKSKIKPILGRLAKDVAKTALGVVSENTDIIDSVSDIFSSDSQPQIGQLHAEIKQNIIKRYSQSDKKGVIFFIDDLDRLNPEVAVELLELLKNIFTIDKCVFILAIDYDVVVKGLKSKFGDLTDSNEREFRSFFDKIIQVPFAMPISNYKPEDLIISSLKSISYIDETDLEDNEFKKKIMYATKMTVGNNPRSIKRLMNVLSLVRCISHATGDLEKHINIESRFGKYINFVILAIQVQFPKIFRMLLVKPDFTRWDDHTVRKMNATVVSQEKIGRLQNDELSDEPWELALYAVCESDAYLKRRFSDISELLNRVREEIEKPLSKLADDKKEVGDVMRDAIQITSITSFTVNDSNPVSVDETEWKRFVNSLHNSVCERLQLDYPDWEIKKKRNTGNGGFKFEEPIKLDVPFSRITEDGPGMTFYIPGAWPLPGTNYKGFETREQMIDNPEIKNIMTELDKVIQEYKDKNEWLEWDGMYAYNHVTSNFKQNEAIRYPDLRIKVADIQTFLDSEKIKIISEIIEAFVISELKIHNFYLKTLPKNTNS